MKKVYAAITAIILLCLLTAAGNFIFKDHVNDLLQEDHSPVLSDKNTAPPDLNSLKEFGIDPFSSSVPVVMIDTYNQKIVGEEKRIVSVAIYDSEDQKNDITGSPSMIVRGKLKFRGNKDAEKKQYRLNFIKNRSNREKKIPFLGMASDSRWILHGPFADRSLMRNYLIYNLARETMEWAPDCRFFELFLDGEYEGVYLAAEPVSVSKNRLNLAKFSMISGRSPYIVLRQRFGEEKLPAETYANQNGFIQRMLDVKYPDPDFIISSQVSFIERDISQFEKALYSENFQYAGISYRDYIDMQSFADYLILNEFAMNRDLGALSSYSYKDLNGKLKMCVWDFDRALNNYKDPLNVKQWIYPANTWFQRMIEDPVFLNYTADRYWELRKSTLSSEHIEALMREAENQLSDAAERDFLRWGEYREEFPLLERPGEKRNFQNFLQTEDFLRLMIEKRLTFMDEEITKFQTAQKSH